jgi:hypothetical protein
MPNAFDPSSVAKSVHDSLEEAYAALPPGKSHAVLVDASTDSGVRALYVQRVGDGWNVALEGEWRGRGHAAGKVTALKAW